MTTRIDAEALTTFGVHPEGTHVSINVRDTDGQPAALVLPVDCVDQLMMSLPRIVDTALRNKSKNGGLRMVHPLDCFYLELGEITGAGIQQFILTIDTGRGFHASFAVPEAVLMTLARTIMNDVKDPLTPSVDSAMH